MFSLLAALLIALPDSTPRFVVVDSAVRARLAHEWDARNPRQLERGYCVAYVEDEAWDVPVYRVWALERAATVRATTNTLLADCPVGASIAYLHIHPPASCDWKGLCRLGGIDAFECFPSEQDQYDLDHSDEPFGLIQCDRNAIVPYFRANHEP